MERKLVGYNPRSCKESDRREHTHPKQEMQEMGIQSLGQEDPLEQEMATHSSISCLENPMDRGAWKATVHGVTKSQT